MKIIKKTLAVIILSSFLVFPFGIQAADISTIVYIECGYIIFDNYYQATSGSGVVISDNVVITNAHVVTDEYGDYYDYCAGGIAPNSYTSPSLDFFLEPSSAARLDDNLDYALMIAYDWLWNDYYFDNFALLGNADSLVVGDEIEAVGYPTIGGSTLTTTTGSVSGFDGVYWIKSDVNTDYGNSGGAAFDAANYLIGLTTQAIAGGFSSVSYIQNINAIFEDALGSYSFQRDYNTLYESDNYVCWDEICYNIGIDEGEVSDGFDSIESDSQTENSTENNPATQEENYDQTLTERLLGYILLQVNANGEAWYVHPDEGKRYYMENGDVAYEMMRSFGLGITDINLDDIPSVDTANEMLESESACDTNSIANRLRGQILLQVEQHGEAWYVHPDRCRRIYMKDGDAAYDIMRFLSLGVSNENISKIEMGIIN